MNIEFKIMNPIVSDRIPSPTYKTDGSASLDLRAAIEANKIINPGEKVLIPTGIAINIDDITTCAFILPKSGLGHKQGIILGNGTELVNSDDQDELFISIINTGIDPYMIEVGECVAQILFVQIKKANLKKVTSFTKNKKSDATSESPTKSSNIIESNKETFVNANLVNEHTKEVSKLIDGINTKYADVDKISRDNHLKLVESLTAVNDNHQKIKSLNDLFEKNISDIKSQQKIELSKLDTRLVELSKSIGLSIDKASSNLNDEFNKRLLQLESTKKTELENEKINVEKVDQIVNSIKQLKDDSSKQLTNYEKDKQNISQFNVNFAAFKDESNKKFLDYESDNEKLQKALQILSDGNIKLRDEIKTSEKTCEMISDDFDKLSAEVKQLRSEMQLMKNGNAIDNKKIIKKPIANKNMKK